MSRARAFALGGLLVLLATLLLGLMIPNAAPARLAFFWSQGWVLPLWVILALFLGGGGLGAGTIGLLLWIREHSARRQAEMRLRAVDAEVRELRRLLARETVDSSKDAGPSTT